MNGALKMYQILTSSPLDGAEAAKYLIISKTNGSTSSKDNSVKADY
jgi:hypothetical protein